MAAPNIKSEVQYEAALERLSSLIGAKPGTAKAREFARLAEAVEQHEDEHHPIQPLDPADMLEFRADQLGALTSAVNLRNTRLVAFKTGRQAGTRLARTTKSVRYKAVKPTRVHAKKK